MKKMNWIQELINEFKAFFKDIVMVPQVKEMEYIPVEPSVVDNNPLPIVEIPTVQPVATTTKPAPAPVKSAREHLYDTAYKCIDIDASPKDQADDDLACAESVWNVANKAFPGRVGFPLTLGTIALVKGLKSSKYWKEVDKPDYGDIIIDETGTGKTGAIYHGHTGIVGKHQIMNNNSSNGLWQPTYTQKTWDDRYVKKGGFKNRYFRRISF